MNQIYKKNIIFLSLLFVFISNYCFAYHPSSTSNQISLSEFLLISLLITSIPLYFFVIKPYIKMKKTKNYCEKNHLVFTAESNKLPNNIKFKFIKIEAGMDSKIKYKNIIHGERNGIFFIICEFNISFSNTKGTGYTSNFPLLIIKKDNVIFPSFFLKSGNSFKNYISFNSFSGEKNGSSYVQADFNNHAHFYKGFSLTFAEDSNFNKKFVLEVENKESAKIFFNNDIRNLFKERSNPDYVYGGDGDYFIVSKPIESSFEETIQFFEENLKLFVEITSNL